VEPVAAGVDEALARFEALPVAEAERELLDCCASEAWARAVAEGRPYADREAVVARSDAVLRVMPWTDVERALAGHPRIGERAAGAERAAVWSRGEQAGATAASGETRAALAAGNAEYERRFGHVYLVCATGRDADELVALLRGRLGNEPETERQVVRTELAKITGLRLAKLLS
jgi:2-oxo-4-hydroxy-4-carboxy-5-ureidoimidazoline decarboxylase